MTTLSSQSAPWAQGPREILVHVMDLIEKDTDPSRRIAFLLADNAVELTIKTFLSLPERVTAINLARRKFDEIAESFPTLIGALETYASEKVQGLDLGQLEWLHRVRNQLYHSGQGLTVQRSLVEAYAALANALFQRLFGESLVKVNVSQTYIDRPTFRLSTVWDTFVAKIDSSASRKGKFLPPYMNLEERISALVALDLLTKDEVTKLLEIGKESPKESWREWEGDAARLKMHAIFLENLTEQLDIR